jgi:uncharacterized protein YbgA (DUF1722 family)/uncharacterized protein YbbK (DUF523 family)
MSGLYEYRGICPEVAIGMGVPREPIRLADINRMVRAIGVRDPADDFTELLHLYGEKVALELGDVSGYVFMNGSPSCGLYHVKVYPYQCGTSSGAPERSGRGIFARSIVAGLPELPVEECGRLDDLVLRENFIIRTFAYAHWRELTSGGLSRTNLIAFHNRYKYLLMAHSVQHYQQAERLIVNLESNMETNSNRYLRILLAGLARTASRAGHANVLAHLQSYLRRRLDGPARRELAMLITSYRRGEQPLLAPVALLKHELRRSPDTYLRYQTYLDPYPETG